MSNSRLLITVLRRALRHPRLLVLMPSIGWRFRRRDWYRRWPFLPLPPADYLAWRLHTAFGSEDALPSGDQVEAYLTWAQRARKH